MKKIVLALTFVLVGSFMLAGCSKDKILNQFAIQKEKFTNAQVKTPASVPQKIE